MLADLSYVVNRDAANTFLQHLQILMLADLSCVVNRDAYVVNRDALLDTWLACVSVSSGLATALGLSWLADLSYVVNRDAANTFLCIA
jgi:hypothetical protein